MAYVLFVVDDEPKGLSVIESVARFFAQEGYRAEVMTDGAQAWEQMQEACPDVLVCDMMLPNRDGFELLRELRRRQPETAGSILLGSVSAEAGRYLAFGEGFFQDVDALIIKPYRGGPEKLAPWPLDYKEQLIVSVGHLLYRLGLYQAAV